MFLDGRVLSDGVVGAYLPQAAGALLFTCNGRGSRLFSGPDHDAGLLGKVLGDITGGGIVLLG